MNPAIISLLYLNAGIYRNPSVKKQDSSRESIIKAAIGNGLLVPTVKALDSMRYDAEITENARILRDTCRLINSSGLDYVLLKTFRNHDRIPNDLDIFVKDIDKAIKILRTKGFDVHERDEKEKKVMMISKNHWKVHLHARIRWAARDFFSLESIFKDTREVLFMGEKMIIPSYDLDFLMHIAHMNYEPLQLTLSEMLYLFTIAGNVHIRKTIKEADDFGWSKCYKRTLYILNNLHKRFYGRYIFHKHMTAQIDFKAEDFPLKFSRKHIISSFIEAGLIGYAVSKIGKVFKILLENKPEDFTHPPEGRLGARSDSLSIAITTFNRHKKLIRLLETIREADLKGIDHEIIVIDNGSKKKVTRELLKELESEKSKHGEVKVVYANKGVNISAARNAGFSNATKKNIIFLDDDVTVTKDMFKRLLSSLDRFNGKALIAPLMFEYKDKEKVWFAGVHHNLWTTWGTFPKGTEGEFISSDALLTCFIMRMSILEDIRPLDDVILPIHFEEMDFGVRAGLRGYKVLVDTGATLYHDHEGAPFLIKDDRLYYEARSRIITTKLWSRNILQRYVSLMFAIGKSLLHIPVKMLLYRSNPVKDSRIILKGIYDGINISMQLQPYRSRDMNRPL